MRPSKLMPSAGAILSCTSAMLCLDVRGHTFAVLAGVSESFMQFGRSVPLVLNTPTICRMMSISDSISGRYDRSLKWLLSPNIINVRGLWRRLIPALRKARVDRDQGWWIRDPRGMRRLGNFSSYELIYVNDDCRVLKVMRTRSRFIIPWVQSAAGVLALTTTPSARATRAGNEL
jgi:hypothetical protein